MSTVFQVCIFENLSTASQDAGEEVPWIDILWQQNLRTQAKNVYSVTDMNCGRFTTANMSCGAELLVAHSRLRNYDYRLNRQQQSVSSQSC